MCWGGGGGGNVDGGLKEGGILGWRKEKKVVVIFHG